MKECCICKETKSLDEFSWRNKAKGQKSKECKECHAKIRAKYYERNKSSEISYVSQRRKELSKWLKEYKSNLKCNRCGEDHPATLEFHHINPAEKEVAISQVIRVKGWSIDRIMEEVNKCEVLCCNCHRKEHWRQ